MSNEYSIKDIIVGKVDQLNAEQLWNNPLVINITAIKKVANPQQPLIISYANDNGRPFKPCLTMRKVLAHLWGEDDFRLYIGRSLKLYCDQKVSFGDQKEIGGVRISHASNMPKDAARIEIPLTVKRGEKRKYIVERIDITDPLEQHKNALTAARGMKALVDTWTAIPKNLHAQLSAHKDSLKDAAAKFDADNTQPATPSDETL